MILLVVGGVALVGFLVVVALVVLANIPTRNALEVDGDPIVNAEIALRYAEGSAELEVKLAEIGPADVRTTADLRCGFSYPEDGSTPEDVLLCGPVVFGDSEPGTWLLEVPVSYDPLSDGVKVTVEDIESLRTVAPKPGHELVRPDGKEVELGSLDDGRGNPERPAAAVAEPGDMGFIPPEGLMVDLAEIEEGELRSFLDLEAEVVRSGWADRVRLQDEVLEPATVRAAPERHRWLIFELAGDLEPAANFDVVAGELELAVVADDDRFSLDDGLDWTSLYIHDATLLAVVVPEDAEDVSFVIDDGVAEQGWSFTEEERSGDSPAILDRDPDMLTAQIDQEFALPYGARDLNPDPGPPPPPPDLDIEPLPPLDISRPFGAQELKLQVGEARLGYALDPGLSADSPHAASGPDRALLYLADVQESWGNLFPDIPEASPESFVGYSLPADGAVLVLPDGTEIVASRFPGEPIPTTAEPGIFVPLQQGLFGGLVWDVPADIETATLRITFKPANDAVGTFEIYFQEATIEMGLDFAASS